MRPFAFKRAAAPADAVKFVAANKDARFIAGGTNLVDLIKEGVDSPNELVDISRLPLSTVRAMAGGSITIGALAKNTDTANHPIVRKDFPLLTQAILAGASPQIRNMATNGGNLMQRTRCHYFYDLATPCNKRQPGSGCAAKDGLNRYSAIFGWSDSCVAVHPSDMCVALAALDAMVNVQGMDGKTRTIKFTDFHRLPEASPEKDNTLAHGELIVSIDVPKNNFAANSYYLKVRDRASYAFALVSVAAALHVERGTIRSARLTLGGVAHKPWRAADAERFLVDKRAGAGVFQEAADLAVKDAKPLSENGYKVKLAQRAVAKALGRAANL
ncbi:MAG: xanthine dehydrogenase family protein subunit M [Pyrinomonadaceae bacterium]